MNNLKQTVYCNSQKFEKLLAAVVIFRAAIVELGECAFNVEFNIAFPDNFITVLCVTIATFTCCHLYSRKRSFTVGIFRPLMLLYRVGSWLAGVTNFSCILFLLKFTLSPYHYQHPQYHVSLIFMRVKFFQLLHTSAIASCPVHTYVRTYIGIYRSAWWVLICDSVDFTRNCNSFK